MYLHEVGEPASIEAALHLLDLLLRDFPAQLELAQAHKQRAECLTALGHRDAALAAYRDALGAERQFPNVKTDAYIGLGELTLLLERVDLYPEVLSILDEFGGAEAFPIQRYRIFAVRAFIYERSGRLSEARQFAELALDAADATESPFRYHRTLGLVTNRRSDAHGRLLSLAGRAH